MSLPDRPGFAPVAEDRSAGLTTTAAAEVSPAADDRGLREQVLRALPGCRPETIERLLQTVVVRSVEADDLIYRQGDPVPLTLILDGYGAARRTTINGRELVSGIALAGVLFGWSGLASVPSSVELVALTRSTVAQWPGEEIRQLSAADPGLALVAIDSMAWSLHQTVERIEGFLHQDARLRVLRVLAQYRELIFGASPVLTRARLPGLVGTSREMTGHVLRQLEREGTIARLPNGGLQLLRPDRLEAGGS